MYYRKQINPYKVGHVFGAVYFEKKYSNTLIKSRRPKYHIYDAVHPSTPMFPDISF